MSNGFFTGASGFTINDSEFNNVAGNVYKSVDNGKTEIRDSFNTSSVSYNGSFNDNSSRVNSSGYSPSPPPGHYGPQYSGHNPPPNWDPQSPPPSHSPQYNHYGGPPSSGHRPHPHQYQPSQSPWPQQQPPRGQNLPPQSHVMQQSPAFHPPGMPPHAVEALRQAHRLTQEAQRMQQGAADMRSHSSHNVYSNVHENSNNDYSNNVHYNTTSMQSVGNPGGNSPLVANNPFRPNRNFNEHEQSYPPTRPPAQPLVQPQSTRQAPVHLPQATSFQEPKPRQTESPYVSYTYASASGQSAWGPSEQPRLVRQDSEGSDGGLSYISAVPSPRPARTPVPAPDTALSPLLGLASSPFMRSLNDTSITSTLLQADPPAGSSEDGLREKLAQQERELEELRAKLENAQIRPKSSNGNPVSIHNDGRHTTVKTGRESRIFEDDGSQNVTSNILFSHNHEEIKIHRLPSERDEPLRVPEPSYHLGPFDPYSVPENPILFPMQATMPPEEPRTKKQAPLDLPDDEIAEVNFPVPDCRPKSALSNPSRSRRSSNLSVRFDRPLDHDEPGSPTVVDVHSKDKGKNKEKTAETSKPRKRRSSFVKIFGSKKDKRPKETDHDDSDSDSGPLPEEMLDRLFEKDREKERKEKKSLLNRMTGTLRKNSKNSED
ncbi:hypothetical protein FA15DRAFT_666881 [Coprinopsis marcescibilis]|uniref:Uncharacterized protein n=1 Tax=Coprinopsis marcescibilis TaxID=230819 RepID=A0A5C3L2X9_COPMA|nr:hypothetical protein FA15DRAFT_666881 [Coprinopsis marcescibilis]